MSKERRLAKRTGCFRGSVETGKSECGCKTRKAQSHPLRLELFAAHGFGDGIFKHAVVVPELEFLQ